MTTPMETSRKRMDEIHTQMARLTKAINRRGAMQDPTWADAADLAQLRNLLTDAADWAEQE